MTNNTSTPDLSTNSRTYSFRIDGNGLLKRLVLIVVLMLIGLLTGYNLGKSKPVPMTEHEMKMKKLEWEREVVDLANKACPDKFEIDYVNNYWKCIWVKN